MAAPSTERPAPTDWHKKPANVKGPCPICGLSTAQAGEHRATREDEDELWVKRRRHKGAWRFTRIGNRRAVTQAPTELSKAAEILAAGGSVKNAASAAAVCISVLRTWRVQHSHAFGQAFAAALGAIDPAAWHQTPRDYDTCPVCGFRESGEHRFADGNWECKGAPQTTTPSPVPAKSNGQPAGPSSHVIKGMSVATFALATGATLPEAAQLAGVSYHAMRDWKRSHPEHWESLYSNAMKQTVEAVRTMAGTDAALDDPRYIKKASEAEKWTRSRGESLFETSDRPTLGTFYRDYYRPVCLAGVQSSTLETYETHVRHWVLLTGDPPLEEITNEVLAKFRECQSRMRGAKPSDRKSPNSVRSVLRHIQAILDKAGTPGRRNRDAAGIITQSPYARPPKAIHRVPRIASLDAIDDVYRACVAADLPRIEGIKPAAWWRALLITTLNTGFRRGTLFSMRMADMRWQDRSILVNPEQVKNSIGGVIPLNDTTIEHLRAIRTDRELLFPWHHCPKHFYTSFYRIQEAAGIPAKDRFALHAIRRLAATTLWEQSPAVAQMMLGHASLDTTRRHYVFGGDMLRRAVDQLPQPASLKGTTDGNNCGT